MIRHEEPAHRRTDLDPGEALRLLSTVSLGRIAFTRQALPTVRPVNHVLDDGDIVIRTHEGAALTAHARHGGVMGAVRGAGPRCTHTPPPGHGRVPHGRGRILYGGYDGVSGRSSV
ncbi:pyridoxamine 5'-phosphate oxidase family protein [Streptomyces sp. IMTB 2501]|uniref:pyridoxamine 5'-phosphate oxidase family protein n=1 Tax=Streptomyces sp. IMTB 2501 TaxID=1776340 RepID=UPI0021168112|nr:pyridoxamine 5'-phosphate oxidase family protein [Streptomyces sp. IMTB 2501]